MTTMMETRDLKINFETDKIVSNSSNIAEANLKKT